MPTHSDASLHLNDLPAPESAEIAEILSSDELRAIYEILYLRREEEPPTMLEIREFVAAKLGRSHSQTDRRVRSLRRVFSIVTDSSDRGYVYRLVGRAAISHDTIAARISLRVRARVLAPGRCAMCGRRPSEHGVVLVVDHKIPQTWGGDDEIDNLQPLCEDCNAGKRDWYATQKVYDEQIRAAIDFDEPHRRIGELLKAFAGEPVPGHLVGIVASAKQHQEDWQKRTRELRLLDWKIDVKKVNTPQRVVTYYSARHWEPWPSGPIARSIKAVELTRKLAKRAASDENGTLLA